MAVLGQIIGFNPEDGCIYFELIEEEVAEDDASIE